MVTILLIIQRWVLHFFSIIYIKLKRKIMELKLLAFKKMKEFFLAQQKREGMDEIFHLEEGNKYSIYDQ